MAKENYVIENGFLLKNGKRVLALGQSYYPSFHYAKYPVPPDGDRIGEMKKDLKMMSDMGFNHVRFAALGENKLDENGNMSVCTPFIDKMIDEADENGISVSVRLQGYAVNLRGFENVLMVDSDGEPQGDVWFDFIKTTLHHEGILEDNRTFAVALSRHYKNFSNVIAMQIYNEPHYPGIKFFDYHPKAVGAYRKWLVKKGIMTESEAKTYYPPRGRKEQGDRMWALWRVFSMESVNMFLDNSSDSAKAESGLPTYTCYTTDQISNQNVYRGCDIFGNAKTMDVVGYTSYFHGFGEEYYQMSLLGDLAQCAAELEGKQAWCIELDSRTYIPQNIFNRNTYLTLGTGCKGILYYQWRGDCPVPGVPYPNSCGLLNFDGTKTKNYDNAAKAVKLMNEMSDIFVGAHRVHMGIGLLHSDYAAFMCDARENPDVQKRGAGIRNSYVSDNLEIYRRLRIAGYTVSITDAEHLDKDTLGIKVLFVPRTKLLSPEEKASVDRFKERGGRVFENFYADGYAGGIGFNEYPLPKRPYTETVYDPAYSVRDVADLTGIYPMVYSLDPDVCTQLLEGDGYKVIVLTNLSVTKTAVNARIKAEFPITGAIVRAFDGDKEAKISDGIISVDGITDGAVIVIK